MTLDSRLWADADALTPADRAALRDLAELLWNRRQAIAAGWSRRLMALFTESFASATVSLDQLIEVNLSFLSHILEHARSGDLLRLYDGFYRLNRQLVEDDLRRTGPRISLQTLYASARVSIAVINDELGPGNERLMLVYAKLTAQLMMLVGCAYSDCREEHLQRAEQALRKSEARMRRLMEATPDAMVIADRDGRIALVNVQAEWLFGYPRAELLGQPVEILVPERYREEHTHHRARYVNAPSVRPMGAGFELYGRRKDASEFPVEISLSPLETEEGLLVTSTIRDITERKQAERLSASLQEKDVLLKELHHRVKNNLQVISSLLAMQSRHVRDPRALELFKESENRVRSMAAIHEALYRSPNLPHLDSESFIREITNNLLRSYAVKPDAIQLRIEVARLALGIDLAVPCGLIVNELVSNAVKHGFPGGRAGEVRVRFHLDDRRHYVLTVSDNGVGLPSHVDWRRGASMGWQIVHALTEQLGGALRVQGSPGTAFTVTFPAP
jgi:PAS domain S-box-containing protein